MVSLMSSFSAKVYGRRSAENRKKKKAEAVRGVSEGLYLYDVGVSSVHSTAPRETVVLPAVRPSVEPDRQERPRPRHRDRQRLGGVEVHNNP